MIFPIVTWWNKWTIFEESLKGEKHGIFYTASPLVELFHSSYVFHLDIDNRVEHGNTFFLEGEFLNSRSGKNTGLTELKIAIYNRWTCPLYIPRRSWGPRHHWSSHEGKTLQLCYSWCFGLLLYFLCIIRFALDRFENLQIVTSVLGWRIIINVIIVENWNNWNNSSQEDITDKDVEENAFNDFIRT